MRFPAQYLIPLLLAIGAAALSTGFDTQPETGTEARPPVAVDAPRTSLAELCQLHGDTVAWRLGEECQVVVRPPWIVAGDASRDQLADWTENLIEPAARTLAEDYFAAPPDEPVTALLFSSEAAYRLYAERLFADRDVSRFGYYKPDRRTLLVNMSEGPGPLLHELTHALMAFDFPDAPPWLVEGLAVLHESAAVDRERGLQLRGLPSWRMRLLHDAAHRDALPPLSELFAAKSLSQPGPQDEALAYAQAGGFCWFLQRQGKLSDVYRALRDSIDGDAGTSRIVKTVLATTSTDDADLAFQQWLTQQAP